MFESLYGSIGEKIKSLAKVGFVAETILVLLGGFCLLFAEDLQVLGLLTMVIGPIVAQNLQKNQWKTEDKEAARFMQAKTEDYRATNKSNEKVQPVLDETGESIECPVCKYAQPRGRKVCWKCGVAFEEPREAQPKKQIEAVEHTWLCRVCGKMRAKSPCEYCGKE